MDNQIFRKKNIERVSSPEQLNDYVRVSNPGVDGIESSHCFTVWDMCLGSLGESGNDFTYCMHLSGWQNDLLCF